MKGMLKDALEETAWTILLQELHAQLRMIYQGKINMNLVLYYKQDEHGHYRCLAPAEDKDETFLTQRYKLGLLYYELYVFCTINHTLSVPCLTE